MVTLDNMDKKTLGDLASVLSASSKTWDLVDLKKKDQWMIKTLAVLGEDPEAKTAVMKGPITLEIVRAAEPGHAGERVLSWRGCVRFPCTRSVRGRGRGCRGLGVPRRRVAALNPNRGWGPCRATLFLSVRGQN